MNIQNETGPDDAVVVEEPRLYKAREPIFPKDASGFFRRMKWRILLFALAVYYVTPWIRWDRGPHAPDQAVLVDLANRRFYFFFLEIWPQEFYFIAGLLIMAGVGLFLITSAVGRAWCGYFCPQTVWTDLFMWVERRIDGDRNAQIRLHRQGWTAEKLRKRTAKHAVWIAIALATGGAWVFYFRDAPTLLRELVTGEAAMVAYVTVAVLTFTTYSLAGLMREQVCIYMCPWPRIQGAMLDRNSLTVTYNDWRGEPRARHRKKALAEGARVGDCVDCNACVAVCPMGIDIRNGPQLECITCGLCIDACDSVMEKTGQAKGLIAYTTFADYDRHTAGDTRQVAAWRRVLRPRTLLYFGLWAGIGLVMLALVVGRDRLDLNVLHDRNPQFTRLSSGDIRNGYTIKILNMQARPREFRVGIEGLEGGALEIVGIAGSGRALDVSVGPDRVRELRALVTAPAEAARRDFAFTVEQVGGDERDRVEAAFFGPMR